MHTNSLTWVDWVDDTSAQLRMRLASSTAASQVNLGYLIAQPSHSAQRGSDFELRSDAWGVVRGGDGVLMSTTLLYLEPVQPIECYAAPIILIITQAST